MGHFKKLLVIIFLIYSTFAIPVKAQTYRVLNVTSNKVLLNGKSLKNGQILNLKEKIPPFVNGDFLKRNGFNFSPKGQIILLGSHQFIIDYNNFINKPTSRVATMNSNCSTRGTNDAVFDCNDTIENAKFHLSSFLSSKTKIKRSDCLSLYFNAGQFYITGNDTLVFEDNITFDKLQFHFSDTIVTFTPDKNKIVIDENSLPDQGYFTATLQKGNDKTQIAEGEFYNLKQMILAGKADGFTNKEIAKILIDGPFSEFNFDDKTDKDVLIKIAQLINSTE